MSTITPLISCDHGGNITKVHATDVVFQEGCLYHGFHLGILLCTKFPHDMHTFKWTRVEGFYKLPKHR